ncbi:hypothetical protein C8A01DRAFT_18114 [Parachaetomium inaequale]|uniref:Uncharacterized protein n=1 Tax=Parachaetomium inaequale TaxID=2588326 RepID=A0AAN6PBB0_9PEZI|nr:hypothetical protein C8A01DRAFT_18114 [Parachaetomium inaequale]
MVLEGREDIDQVLLSKYRTELMPQHPFVIIPQHIPAAVLRSHHPFLMTSIRAIASFEGLRTMHTRMQLVTGHIADKMFRQAERSLDLLMGIVVILGWHHYHCARHSQLNNLLCLAESLVSDLGLNKKPLVNHDGEKDERASEEKRLLLGVWYLRSSAAMHFQQLTSMPFTAYMRQCLVEIQEAKAHDLDETLVHCVKIQYLAERVAVLKTLQPKRTDVGNDRIALEGGERDKESQERGVALAGCQTYLDRLVRELPGGLKDDVMIVTQFNTVALRLSEPRGSDVLQCRAAGGSPTSRLPYASDSANLDTLLQAAPVPLRSWFQSWVSCVPVSRYRTLPSHAVFQLLYALRAVVRSQTSEHGNMHGSFQGRAPSTSTSLAVPTGDASVPLDDSESNPSEDAKAVVNRLIALGPNGPDVDKFWASLGELYEDEFASGRAAAEHPSTPDGFAGLGEGVFNAMIMAGRGQRNEATHGDTYPMLQSPGAQGMYSSELFVPPSRVGSAGIGQRVYGDDPLLRLAPMAVVPGASHLPSAHPHQWATAAAWDADPSPWTAPGAAPGAMGHEGMDQQLWDASQGNPPYGWGDGSY